MDRNDHYTDQNHIFVALFGILLEDFWCEIAPLKTTYSLKTSFLWLCRVFGLFFGVILCGHVPLDFTESLSFSKKRSVQKKESSEPLG